MNRRARFSTLGIMLIAGLIGLGLVQRQPGAQHARPHSDIEDGARDDALSQESSLRKLVDADDETYRRSYDTNLAVADPRRVLAQTASGPDLVSHYKAYFRYPHNSRPLNDDMFSLLDPLKIQTSPTPVFKAPGKTTTARPDYVVQFFAPRQSITGDEVFTATLRVEDANGVEVLPTIEQASVLSDVKTGRVGLGQVEQFEGQQPAEGLRGFAWKAPAKTRPYWGELELSVSLDIDGVKLVQTLPFSSTPAAPAKFTGHFSEALVDGSLVVKAELEASEAGSYVFEGSLYQQASDTPVSWSRNIVHVHEGIQNIEYLFFGRIFRDKELAGAFALRHIRGYRINQAYDPGAMLDRTLFMQQQRAQTSDQQARALEIADEPLHQFVAVWPTDYVTEPYALADFSDKEYDGPDKEQTLEAVAQAASGVNDAP
jgi:hypothetical protein